MTKKLFIENLLISAKRHGIERLTIHEPIYNILLKAYNNINGFELADFEHNPDYKTYREIIYQNL